MTSEIEVTEKSFVDEFLCVLSLGHVQGDNIGAEEGNDWYISGRMPPLHPKYAPTDGVLFAEDGCVSVLGGEGVVCVHLEKSSSMDTSLIPNWAARESLSIGS